MEKLLNILEKVLGRSKKSSWNNYAFFSPFTIHRKQKLQIDLTIDSDVNSRPINRWHCWITGRKGMSIYSLFNQPELRDRVTPEIREELNSFFKDLKFNVFIREEINQQQKQYENQLPKEFQYLTEHSTLDAQIAIRYLLNERNLTKDDIIRYGIGYCPRGRYCDRVIVPSYDEGGVLNYFIARDFKDVHYLKYRNPKRDANIVGFESYINWNEPIILVEGIFDAIAVRRNAIPLMGKQLSEELKYKLYVNDVKEIYVALDGDANKDAVSIITYLQNAGMEVYRVPIYEEDPADLGHKRFWERMEQAVFVTYKELTKLKLGL